MIRHPFLLMDHEILIMQQYSIYCFLTVGFPAFDDPDFSLQCFSFFP